MAPDGYNPRVGFTLTDTTVTDSGTLVCDASEGDSEEQAHFHLQVNRKFELKCEKILRVLSENYFEVIIQSTIIQSTLFERYLVCI